MADVEPNKHDTALLADVPEWYTEGQFDALLICTTADKAAACAFTEFIKNTVYRPGERCPRFATLDSLACGANGLKRVQYLMDKSTFVFMYITDYFLTDDVCQLLVDEIVMDSVRAGDCRWRLIPVVPRKLVQPMIMGLKSLNALSLERLMVCPRAEDSFNAVNADTLEYVDSYFAKNIRKLFEDRLYLLQRRLHMDEIKFKFWAHTHGLSAKYADKTSGGSDDGDVVFEETKKKNPKVLMRT